MFIRGAVSQIKSARIDFVLVALWSLAIETQRAVNINILQRDGDEKIGLGFDLCNALSTFFLSESNMWNGECLTLVLN